MYPIHPAESKKKCDNCPTRQCKDQLVTVGTDTRGEGPSFFTTVDGSLCAYVSATSCFASGRSTTLFEYYHLNKKEAKQKNVTILKHIQKSSGLSARMKLWFPETEEDGQCFKNVRTSDSISVIRERMLDMLHKNFMKPDHIRIENLDGPPSEADLAVTKFAIEHQVDIAMLTKNLPPRETLRYIIDNFYSGLALSHLRFYWAQGCLDIEGLLKEFNVIYRGQVEVRGGKLCCRRNFAYVQAVENGPVLSVTYGSCEKKNCGRTFDYHSASRLRSLNGQFDNIPDNPSYLNLQILNKLDNANLVRMRRTCSFMNFLIEENKLKLASRRVGKDCNMRISQFRQTTEFSVRRYNDSEMPEYRGSGVLLSNSDLTKDLSAISIRQIYMHFHADIPWSGDRSTELLYLVSTLKPVCDHLEIDTFSATEKILRLIELVSCININIKLFDHTRLKEAMALLQKSPMRGKIRIINATGSWWKNCPDEDLFDLAKQFRMVDFYSLESADPFWCFIRYLYKSPDHCFLKRMDFCLGFDVDSEFFGEQIENIPFKILYEGKEFEDVERHHINIFYEEKKCGFFYPTHVRQLEAGDKIVFCIGNQGEQEIFIIDRTAGIMDGVDYVTRDVNMMKIIVSKEFLEASDERQMEILQEDGAKYNFHPRT